MIYSFNDLNKQSFILASIFEISVSGNSIIVNRMINDRSISSVLNYDNHKSMLKDYKKAVEAWKDCLKRSSVGEDDKVMGYIPGFENGAEDSDERDYEEDRGFGFI